MNKIQRQKAWECGLPAYLQHDLDAYKEGLRSGSTLIDCLWCELYGSINGVEIDDQAISHAPATAVLHTVSHTSTPDHVSITFDKETPNTKSVRWSSGERNNDDSKLIQS